MLRRTVLAISFLSLLPFSAVAKDGNICSFVYLSAKECVEAHGACTSLEETLTLKGLDEFAKSKGFVGLRAKYVLERNGVDETDVDFECIIPADGYFD